jgi:sulfur carrier protein ThiS
VHDFDAVARLQLKFGMRASRHDTAVDLDRDTAGDRVEIVHALGGG